MHKLCEHGVCQTIDDVAKHVRMDAGTTLWGSLLLELLVYCNFHSHCSVGGGT